MAALMILNPRRSSARKRRAGGRKGGPRKMTAKQLKFFGPRRAKKKSAAPKSRRRATAKAKTIIISTNPKKGASMAKRRKKSHTKRHFLSNPKKRARVNRRFKRNPRIPGASLLHNALIPAAVGAAGALAVDLAMATVPMPNALRRGLVVPVVKIAAALLIGAVVGAVTNREAGEEAAAGGIVVTLYGVARNFVLTRVPGVPLARYVPMGGMGNGRQKLRRYVPNGMGGQPPALRGPGMPSTRGLGYMQPALNRGNLRALASRG